MKAQYSISNSWQIMFDICEHVLCMYICELLDNETICFFGSVIENIDVCIVCVHTLTFYVNKHVIIVFYILLNVWHETFTLLK